MEKLFLTQQTEVAGLEQRFSTCFILHHTGQFVKNPMSHHSKKKKKYLFFP
jgi:hypothetical protein